MNERYLVTGCAGFIAARATEMLLDRGAEVVGLDNLTPAYDPRLKHQRLAALEKRPGFRFLRCDIDEPAEIRAALAEAESDFAAVLHFAGCAGVRSSVLDPWQHVRTNTLGTLNLLDCCRGQGIPKFVLASTSSLYGGTTEFPCREDMPTDRPLSPYAASKKAAEALCHTYHHLHGLDVSVLRFFTVYGPAGRPDMGIFRFIQGIGNGTPLTIYGDGLQERDFTYVDDIARGTLAALRPVGYDVFNLGGDRPIPLREVLAEIERQLGKQAVLHYEPAHSADPHRTWADISKARRLLGWEPQVDLPEGLRRTIAWFREHADWSWNVDLRDLSLLRPHHDAPARRAA